VAANPLQQFGKYELVSKLAAGGMAITYRARMKGAAGVTKPVVIKQILPHFADDPEFVEMFISEARVAASLSHGNLAQVFDFGEIEGQYFLAMELVHGQPLSKVLRRAQRAGLPSLPIPLALHIATEMCNGLDSAHRHVGEDGRAMGLVHRDVSPDNVLISYEGEVKVIDFGIAKATSVVEARTTPGTLKGKYPYFSTEQARGQQDLDARSDIFATGVVLYEMLCGQRPYEGEMHVVLPRIVSGDYPAPSALNPSISPELEQVMGLAMALEREERYPTAQAFAEALREQLYSDNPRFSPMLLSQLMGHLFAEELAAEGRRLEVTPAFMEMLTDWRNRSAGVPPGVRTRPPSTPGRRASSASVPRQRASGSSGRRVTSETTRVSPSIARSEGRRSTSAPVATMVAPHNEEEEERTPVSLPSVPAVDEDSAPPPPRTRETAEDLRRTLREVQTREQQERAERIRRLVLLISVPLFGLSVALALIHSLMSEKDVGPPMGSLWLTSTPAGASLKLNGKDVPGVTPLIVKGVILHEANTLILTLPGYRPWTKRFTPHSEVEPQMHAELERLPPPEPPAPKAPSLPEAGTGTAREEAVARSSDAGGESASGPDFHEVKYPTRLLVLRTRYNALPLKQYATASIELNPHASYSVFTRGTASLERGQRATTGTLAYFIEGDVAPNDAFGLLGPTPRTLKGMRRLHVFLLDDNLEDNSGTVRVHLRQSEWVAPLEFSFNAREDALVPEREHQLVLRGLNPEATYLLTVRDDFAELSTDGKGRVRRVLCVESRRKPAQRNHRLLEVGKRYRLTGVDTLRCTFPDTRVEDNAGALAVDLVDVTSLSRQERAKALRGAQR
jgi:eukaryotic-like serine/threonine-protein kinase